MHAETIAVDFDFNYDNQLEGLTYHYRDIQWFWQFLKLAVDYEGKFLNVGGRLVWEKGHLRKGSKVRKGRSLSKGAGGTTQQLMSKNYFPCCPILPPG